MFGRKKFFKGKVSDQDVRQLSTMPERIENIQGQEVQGDAR